MALKKARCSVNYHRQRRWLVMAHLEGALTQWVAGRSWPKSRRLFSFGECPAGFGAISAEIALLLSSRTHYSMWVCRHSCHAHSTSEGRLPGRTRNQSLGMWGQVVPASTTMPHLLVEPLPVPLPEAVASETSEFQCNQCFSDSISSSSRSASWKAAS
jgi:hypothetical protein